MIPVIPTLAVLSSVDPRTIRTTYICTAYAAVPTLAVPSSVDQRTIRTVYIYVQKKIKSKSNQNKRNPKSGFALLM
jgi:hypothetical protein